MIVSVGTSGVVSAVAEVPAADDTGIVAGFADATGRYLPLVCTLNAAPVLDATATLLGVGLDELSRLALAAPAGAGGLVLVPYLEGERTPDRPDATGALHGLQLATATPAHLARAAVEGLLVRPRRRARRAGAAGRADRAGAARRRRGPLRGAAGRRTRGARPPGARAGAQRLPSPTAPPYRRPGSCRATRSHPEWKGAGTERYEADPTPWVRERYAEVRDLHGVEARCAAVRSRYTP